MTLSVSFRYGKMGSATTTTITTTTTTTTTTTNTTNVVVVVVFIHLCRSPLTTHEGRPPTTIVVF